MSGSLRHPNCPNPPEACRIHMRPFAQGIPTFDGTGNMVDQAPPTTIFDCVTCGAVWTAEYPAGGDPIIVTDKAPTA